MGSRCSIGADSEIPRDCCCYAGIGRRRKVNAAKARAELEEEEEDTDEEEEDHTLGPLLSQQLGDICGVSAALHKVWITRRGGVLLWRDQ
jgi:hypothetical protein